MYRQLEMQHRAGMQQPCPPASQHTTSPPPITTTTTKLRRPVTATAMSKRPRDDTDIPTVTSTALPSTSIASTSTTAPPPPAKYARSSHSPPPSSPMSVQATPSAPTITCTLPSCPQREHGTVDSYETHYAKHHTNRCSDCGKNFPASRILECHIRENHDMFAVLARERGEKIFACFLDDCDKVCVSPGKRRAHLIDKHHYHPSFNFFIVNDGIDRATSLLAASPVRKSRTRVRRVSLGDSSAGSSNTTAVTPADARRPRRKAAVATTSTTNTNTTDAKEPVDGMDVDDAVEDKRTHRKHARSASEPSVGPPSAKQTTAENAGKGGDEDTDMTDLTARMGAIRFVPPSVVRFGRRGAGGGFSKK
ncbi:Zinc finger protein [Drechslerella dactyloides]|uniref:Zinc finger protein n=1 Tax=Drechslerella dactyloides TaxID=74499 RepID=A0AAD6J8H4_DREDA|nr:Zinc finger protein [Drechslerella dactyloides]